MADKNFVLTLVAVLALAVIAGSLRNSYGGATTFSSGVGRSEEQLFEYAGGSSAGAAGYQGNLQPKNPIVEECEKLALEDGLRPNTNAWRRSIRNCQENSARSGRLQSGSSGWRY